METVSNASDIALTGPAAKQRRRSRGFGVARLLEVLEARATSILVLSVIVAVALLGHGLASMTGFPLAYPGSTSVYMLNVVAVIGHVLALALSFGAVMFVDLFLFRYLVFRPVPPHAFEVADFGSRLATVGLAGLWATGAVLVALYWAIDPGQLARPNFIAKMVFVVVLSASSLAIRRRILPILKDKTGCRILESETVANARLILAAAAVSLTSWMFALVLGLGHPVNITIAPLALTYAAATLTVFLALNGLVAMFTDRLPDLKVSSVGYEGNLRTVL